MEFGNKYRAILERKTKDELHGIAKVLQVSGFRKLSKDSLVTAILRTDDRDTLSGLLSRSWWRRHHNHVYGGAGILSLVLGVIFFLMQRSESREPSEDSGSSLSTSSVDRSEVPQSNQDSSSSFAPDDGELKAQVASTVSPKSIHRFH
jgi:hypothetical protein